jgi:catechol 2,3-dioxygenase-like lactoylglutathione lyase family enzyme
VIGYVTLGTNDLERAVAFYDKLFSLLGAGRFMEDPGHFVAWATGPNQPAISVTSPWDGNPATAGNGTMIALVVDSREKVRQVYDRAIELGGHDEGPPGQRMEGFYAAYFRDLDGNKLNVFYTGDE